MSFVDELKRRNVFKVCIAYVILAWLLLQVSATLVPALHLPEWLHSAVAFLLILGFPLALFFAWAYELTPEGLKKEKDVDRNQSITPVTGRKLDYFIIGVLVLALGYFAYDKFVLGPSRVADQVAGSGKVETADKSIAVLAFADMSPEGDQEYFSDGISEELLNVLAKIPGLRVAARTSSFQFKGENRDIIDIGEKLNTAFVLEGSVRKAGSRIRITAQLVDARSGFHLWSETYNRELDDIFAVQDEISAAIVTALKQHLGLQLEAAARVIPTANSEAHQAYLRGRYLVVQRTFDTNAGAVNEFRTAISLDPDYALAHAELANALTTQAFSRWGNLTRSEAVSSATLHAERAMDLDPSLAEAHAATGNVLWLQDNLEEALTHFRHAIRINPNYSDAYHWSGQLLENQFGRYKESFAMHEVSLRLDPLLTVARSSFVKALINRNRMAEADREIEMFSTAAPVYYLNLRAERMSVGGEWANWVLGELDALGRDPKSQGQRRALSWKFALIGLEKEARAVADPPHFRVETYLGRPEDAVTDAEKRLEDDPDSSGLRQTFGHALAGAGDYERARPILEEMWQQSGGRVTEGGRFWNTTAVALIAARQATGDEDDIGELLAAIRDNIRRFREAGIIRAGITRVDYEEGLAAYLAGEREKGLALIAQGVEDGQIIPPGEAYLRVLYDDPGFAPILAKQVARQAREREKVLSVVCTDNPYAAFWQPAEGRCEQFATVDAN